MVKEKLLCVEGVTFKVSYATETNELLAYERVTQVANMLNRNPAIQQQKRVACVVEKLQAMLIQVNTASGIDKNPTWQRVTGNGEFSAE